jgi:mannose-6-phosphate isomerase-like protein (cupin superfamily)
MILDIVNTNSIPCTKQGDRQLQWIVALEGAIKSELYSCCIVEFEPGASAQPPHSHRNCEESIFILKGKGVMMLEGGKSKPVEKGDFLLLRINEIHMLKNTGDAPMQAICFYSAKTDTELYDYLPMSSVGE